MLVLNLPFTLGQLNLCADRYVYVIQWAIKELQLEIPVFKHLNFYKSLHLYFKKINAICQLEHCILQLFSQSFKQDYNQRYQLVLYTHYLLIKKKGAVPVYIKDIKNLVFYNSSHRTLTIWCQIEFTFPHSTATEVGTLYIVFGILNYFHYIFTLDNTMLCLPCTML